MPLAISMGEPAGIGPDLILRLAAEVTGLPEFVVYGAASFMAARSARLGINLQIRTLDWPGEPVPEGCIGVIDVADGIAVADRPGETDTAAAPVVVRAIERAVSDVREGRCSALVTAPIHKGALYSAGFTYPGHTEFLAALCAENGRIPHPVMMLAHERFRAVPATIHVPLHIVSKLITEELITQTVQIVAKDLRDRFGAERARIAVAGLNPHAGEGGTIGVEERDIIAPALDRLRGQGFDLAGPLPGDTLFHPPHWQSYDAVIAMYHDQALIPIKTVAFDKAVNVTLGLPIVRTSPDHGTAFNLAGTGQGSYESMKAAIELAASMSERRN
ncbi:4-hydroxythreonine-4-phosphate dehydrogenase 2 [Devosia pacifica]|uniref:4-hydroxythreonine-4-phosphate dehydrogenase n=1 Tax=Devosia pacifica TaxID=1335967 RepID=A0A918SC99_9HYPH|nr:4-hydroxythreonine-4-phosphate dehydrogenase PdxA [Devosia pacifica]GHA35332.1 4-hydroxythreonine-4-phosphate dehydrogenase 2 [Devosia pacifica]